MKENISINLNGLTDAVSIEEVAALAHKSLMHLNALNAGTGAGNDFLGWLKLPESIVSQLERIEKIAKHLRSVSESTVIIGIGGSYLGARAVIEALSHSFPGHTGKSTMTFFMQVTISARITWLNSWRCSNIKTSQ